MSNEDWPDPQEIVIKRPPVAKLSVEQIPEPARAWITDVAHRMQCPFDFIASSAICMISGVIGAGCTIRPKQRDNWTVVPNLWGGLIGRPGTMKSPAIAAVFQPVRKLEALAAEKYAEDKGGYDAAIAAFDSQRKALKAEMDRRARKGGDIEEIKEHYASLKPPPETSPRKRYLTNDATIESAHKLMAQNPRGLTILRDELVGLLLTWDRDDRKDERYFHLQGWNGYGGYTIDRIGRGTIDTPQLCEVIYGGTQPSKILSYLVQARSDIGNDGLLQRFQLMVYPDDLAGEPKIVDQEPNYEAKDRFFDIIQTLAEMDFTAYGARADESTKIPYFHFAPDAQQFFNDWLLSLEIKLRSNDEDPIMIEHLAKYRSLMPSLALIFHLIEAADKTLITPDGFFAGQEECVLLHNTQLAAKWCQYLETHARRIYGLGLGANASAQAAWKLLQKVRAGLIQDGFSARDVYNQNWSSLDSKDLAQKAINELIDTGWLKEIPPPKPPPKGGRPFTPTYKIHPNAEDLLQKMSDRQPIEC